MSEEQEKWIRARLNEVPMKEPDAGHLQRFKNRLEEKETPRRKNFFFLKAAAILLPLLGLFAWLMYNPEVPNAIADTDSVDSVSTEVAPPMAEVELFFESTLAAQKKLVLAYQLEDSDPLMGFVNHLDTLENNYGQLKRELLRHGRNNTIEASLIQNYRLRIEIMQQLLEHLELKTKQNATYHEPVQTT